MRSTVAMMIVCLLAGVAWSAPPGGPFTIPPASYYDTNSSGVVTFDDVLAVYDQMGTLGPADPRLDIDQDGLITFGDVLDVYFYFLDYDVDRNGAVEQTDVIAVFSQLVLTGPPNLIYDVNNDGFVSSADADAISDSLAQSPWQNQLDRFDVNADGNVSSSDALAIINFLGTSSTLPVFGKCRAPYYDVNGDQNLTALDALQVINEVERRSN